MPRAKVHTFSSKKRKENDNEMMTTSLSKAFNFQWNCAQWKRRSEKIQQQWQQEKSVRHGEIK